MKLIYKESHLGDGTNSMQSPGFEESMLVRATAVLKIYLGNTDTLVVNFSGSYPNASMTLTGPGSSEVTDSLSVTTFLPAGAQIGPQIVSGQTSNNFDFYLVVEVLNRY